ncbi:MAG: restriction endonuclease subunit S [Dehalococcoidia bacterium]|jgi:type I restriction enzyme S subunit
MEKDYEYSVPKRSYKDYPSDWTVIELGNLLERVRRPIDVIPDHEYREIGIRSHGKGLFYKKPVTGRDLGNKAVFWVEADCLIINIIFAWEQAVGITTAREKGMIASHRFPMWRSKRNVELKYLLSFFLTPLGKHLLELASPGGAGRNRTLGQDEFNKTLVCIPSKIKEQQRIVMILSTWDKAIELEERLVGEKKKRKKWLMQNLLTGKKRLPGFKDEWQEVRLGDLGRLTRGKGVNRSNVVEKGYPFISYGEIYTTHNIVIKEYRTFINSKGREECLRIHNGDIIFTGSGESVTEIGKAVAFLFDDETYAGGDTIVLTQKNNNSLFLAYMLNSNNVVQQLTSLGQGYSVVHIYPFQLARISLMLPPLPEQIAIAEILSTADREIDLHEKQLEELKKLKKALMQLLLTGIARVNVQEDLDA